MNADISVSLLKNKIFSIDAWDTAMSNYIQNASGSLHERAYSFLADVLKRIIFTSRDANVQNIPKIKSLLDDIVNSKNSDTQIEMIRFCIGDIHEQLQAQIPSAFQQKLIQCYRKWVELS